MSPYYYVSKHNDLINSLSEQLLSWRKGIDQVQGQNGLVPALDPHHDSLQSASNWKTLLVISRVQGPKLPELYPPEEGNSPPGGGVQRKSYESSEPRGGVQRSTHLSLPAYLTSHSSLHNLLRVFFCMYIKFKFTNKYILFLPCSLYSIGLSYQRDIRPIIIIIIIINNLIFLITKNI